MFPAEANSRGLPHAQSGGFTLIELLVVIAIISLLSSIILASLGQARVKARDSKRIQNLVQLRSALEVYFSVNGYYPLDPNNPTDDPHQLSCWHCLSNGIEQIHSSLSASAYYYDGAQLTVLAPYLSTRLIDPLLSAPGQMISSGGGYWYKVSCDRKNYKFALINAVEDINNVPQIFRDTTFITTNPWLTVNSLASIYSSATAKDWPATLNFGGC